MQKAIILLLLVHSHGRRSFEQQVLQVFMFQECTNSRHQVAMVTRFYKVAPNDSPSSVLDLLHVTVIVIVIYLRSINPS